MSASNRSIARQLLVPGAALLALGLLLQFIGPTLLGQQSNEVMASIPWPLFTVLGFVGTVALMTGSTLVAGALIARVVVEHVTARATSRDVTMRFDEEA